MTYLNILYSQSLDRYYIGSTRGNIEDRLAKHLTNHKGFTSRFKDWIVVYQESFPEYTLALAREKEIKNWKSRKMIEKLFKLP